MVWVPYSLAMYDAARQKEAARPLPRRVQELGYGWDIPNNSPTLLELEEHMRAHLMAVSQQPLFTTPIMWAAHLTPALLDRLKAVYEEIVRANGENARWGQVNVPNFVLAICFRLAYTEQMANIKVAHMAEAMGFEPPQRCTFRHTRDRFFVYLQTSPPMQMQMPPPPPPVSYDMFMMGVHGLTAFTAAPPQELPQEPPQQETPPGSPQEAPPQEQEPPPEEPLMWSIDEIVEVVFGMEDDELGQLASLAAMI